LIQLATVHAADPRGQTHCGRGDPHRHEMTRKKLIDRETAIGVHPNS
jgi:hypothetical protein